MKKLIAFVVILAAAGGGWWYYIKYGKPPEKATVNYATVSTGPILETVTSTGTLESERRFDVGSQVSGVVKAIYVDYNDIVKEGQLLAIIDPQLLQTQVEIRKAAISRQESDILNQQVQLEDQQKQLDRTKSLFEKGLQNQQQMEAAELAVKTRKAQIESAKKSLVQAQADLSQAELNVSYTQIKAPADGVVVERKVDVGQTVQASMTTPSFFVLAKPLQNLRLTALVDEADIGRIRPGMEVRFNVESYQGQTFYGTVDAVRLNAMTTNNVVTYPVWISVPNPDLKLRPSMTASLRIVISTANDVVKVPNQATRFRPNAEIYTALGLEPPAAGSGGRLGGPDEARNGDTGGPGGQPGQNRQGGGQNRQNVQGGQQGGQNRQQGGTQAGGGQTGGGQNRQGMQGGGQGGGNRTPGQGFGRNPDGSSMTPEQMKQRMAEFMARSGGGRGGQTGGRGAGGGGRGGNQGNRQGGNRGQNAGNRGAQPPAVPTEAQRTADKIDELWADVVKPETRANVYTWNEQTKELKQHPLRLGVSDGTWSELLSGDIKPGDNLVTGVILPASMRQNSTNPLSPFGGQQNRGMGGMQPGGGGPGGGGPGGGGPGGGGGRTPGGGGGGRGGGGN